MFKTIADIQIALISLNGGAPDGIIGPRTITAVSNFQKHISKKEVTGNFEDIKSDLEEIWNKYLTNYNHLHCPCNECDGYGKGAGADMYRTGKPEIEAYYQYEYPGISKIPLWGAKIINAMYPQYTWNFTSGYRCDIDNENHGRHSTNHHGKAIDIQPFISDRDELVDLCDDIRKELYDLGFMNIGWNVSNMISLEPSRIAPTWIHLDCRAFIRKYIINTMYKW